MCERNVVLFIDASRLEDRAVVWFLVVKSERNVDIYWRMLTAYGNHCLGHISVKKMLQKIP